MTSNQQVHSRKLRRMFGAASLLAIAAGSAPFAAHAQAADSAVDSGSVTCSCPTTSAKVAGRYFR